jgi:signal transduction histidine kinase
VPRLEALVATYQRVREAKLVIEHDGSTGKVAMSPDAFDTAVTHLLNNAVEASPGQIVQLRVRHEASRVVIEIVDHGSGMSAEFIRDQLFQPFRTQKQGGSGIGAFQARDLLREAGGELVVISEQGIGTTMRIILARADLAGQAQAERAALSVAGE